MGPPAILGFARVRADVGAILRRECSPRPSGRRGAVRPRCSRLADSRAFVVGCDGGLICLALLGQGRWPATVAAGVYLASPFLLAHTFEGHYPHVWAAAWYPRAFWALGEAQTRVQCGRLILPVVLAIDVSGGSSAGVVAPGSVLSAWTLADGAVVSRVHGGEKGRVSVPCVVCRGCIIAGPPPPHRSLRRSSQPGPGPRATTTRSHGRLCSQALSPGSPERTSVAQSDGSRRPRRLFR